MIGPKPQPKPKVVTNIQVSMSPTNHTKLIVKNRLNLNPRPRKPQTPKTFSKNGLQVAQSLCAVQEPVTPD